jgi:hypothetical protein
MPPGFGNVTPIEAMCAPTAVATKFDVRGGDTYGTNCFPQRFLSTRIGVSAVTGDIMEPPGRTVQQTHRIEDYTLEFRQEEEDQCTGISISLTFSAALSS